MPRGTAPELVVCALDATQGLEAFLIETREMHWYCWLALIVLYLAATYGDEPPEGGDFMP